MCSRSLKEACLLVDGAVCLLSYLLGLKHLNAGANRLVGGGGAGS